MQKYSQFIIGLLVFFISCSSVQINPFVKKKEEIYSNIKTIALQPMVFPKDLPDQKELREYFEELITKKLKSYGFTVIPSDKYGAIYNAMLKSMGGMFDQNTGAFNEEKHNVIIMHCLRQMKALYRADAVLFSDVAVLIAEFTDSSASWDGTSEMIATLSSILPAFIGVSYNGKCPVLSLRVKLVDVFNNPYYYNRGGLQATVKLVAGKLVNIPVNELMRDGKMIVKSVNIALDPMERKKQY
jgi:hypothetical protein